MQVSPQLKTTYENIRGNDRKFPFALQRFCINVGFNADSKGNIISIDAKQPKTFADQMLEYSKLTLTFKKHLL
jgi:hypothetical protein